MGRLLIETYGDLKRCGSRGPSYCVPPWYFFATYVGYQLQLVLFLVHGFLSPWWRRRQVPPKRRFLQEPHGLTTQKTPFFIVTAMKTSNPLRVANYARSPKIAGSIPIECTGFLSRPNTSNLTKAPGSTYPPTEMSTTNRPGGEWRGGIKLANLTAIYEPTVHKISEPRLSVTRLPLPLPICFWLFVFRWYNGNQFVL
jgi:hypothetical protein